MRLSYYYCEAPNRKDALEMFNKEICEKHHGVRVISVIEDRKLIPETNYFINQYIYYYMLEEI